MIQTSNQHVSTDDDLWNARDHSLTSDKLFQFLWFCMKLLAIAKTILISALLPNSAEVESCSKDFFNEFQVMYTHI